MFLVLFVLYNVEENWSHQSAVIQATDRKSEGERQIEIHSQPMFLPAQFLSFPSSLHLPNEISTALSNTLHPFSLYMSE